MAAPSASSEMVYLQKGSWLAIMLVLEAAIAFGGSSVTQSARETSVIMTRVLNNSITSDTMTALLQNFVTRLNGRSLHVRNCFIKINWSIFVHVRAFREKVIIGIQFH